MTDHTITATHLAEGLREGRYSVNAADWHPETLGLLLEDVAVRRMTPEVLASLAAARAQFEALQDAIKAMDAAALRLADHLEPCA
jgi:hypothetical protein